MRLEVDRDSGVPVGTQLTSRLRGAIERGELSPGERLPSLRAAAAAAGVNINTMRAAYSKLEAAGIVVTEQGRGTFVAAGAAAAASRGSGAGAAADVPRAGGDDAELRRRLRDEIARLEAELVRLPPRAAEPGSFEPHPTPGRDRPGARVLSLDELATVRDLLAERVDELRAARTEVLERQAAARDVPGRDLPGRDVPGRDAARASGRAPARRSSSSLAGARIRWTGA